MIIRNIGRTAAIFFSLMLLLATAFTAPSAGGEDADMAAQPDFEELKTMPLIAVIETAAAPYLVLLAEPDEPAPPVVNQNAVKAFAGINGLDPQLRRLIWLTWILRCWGPDDDEGLHSFFYLWGGDYAEQTLDALLGSGLERQARIFRQAMAAFGPSYPADRKARAQFFAWSRPATKVDETTSIPQPLNAFDKTIMALGAAFGSREDFGRAVEDVVSNAPELRAWAEQERAAMSDDERLEWLMNRLLSAGLPDVPQRIAAWPDAYGQLYLLEIFNDEMLNGGVHQFFFNGSGSLAPEVVGALREAGLLKHADAVQRGIDMFPSPYPVDIAARRRYFSIQEKTTSGWDEKLDALTAGVDDGAINAAMLAIAKREGVLPK